MTSSGKARRENAEIERRVKRRAQRLQRNRWPPSWVVPSFITTSELQRGQGIDPSFLHSDYLPHAAAREPVQYTYDASGNRLTMVDPTGATSWTYDSLNRVTAVSQPSVGQVTYGYDAASNRTSLGLPGGGSVSYTFDAANRLASVVHTAQRTTSFTYDAASRGSHQSG